MLTDFFHMTDYLLTELSIKSNADLIFISRSNLLPLSVPDQVVPLFHNYHN